MKKNIPIQYIVNSLFLMTILGGKMTLAASSYSAPLSFLELTTRFIEASLPILFIVILFYLIVLGIVYLLQVKDSEQKEIIGKKFKIALISMLALFPLSIFVIPFLPALYKATNDPIYNFINEKRSPSPINSNFKSSFN